MVRVMAMRPSERVNLSYRIGAGIAGVGLVIVGYVVWRIFIS